MGDDPGLPPPSHRVHLRNLPRTPFNRLIRHLSDLLCRACPQTAHTRSGLLVPIHDRTERRIYERMFVEDMFPLGAQCHRLRTPRPMVADIGAHVGMFALSVTDWFPEARIHLFEPVPRLADRAATLARLNGLSANWRINRAVIGDRSGEARLHGPGSVLGATLLADKAIRMGCRRSMIVPMMRLDDYATAHGLDRFDIIKIDTEGCEYAAISSAQAALAQVSLVFVRVFPPYSTHEGVDAMLRSHGLQVVGDVHADNHEHLWVRA